MIHPMAVPTNCAYCGDSPVFESTWTDNNLKDHSIWLCAKCDTLGLKDLMDYYEADPYAAAQPLDKGSST